MGRKKKFIEKGEGVKFYLVHRSQRDPLYLDEKLGEHVLVPVEGEENVSRELIDAVNGLNISHSAKSRKEREELRLKRLEEQQKYGIYYDDDYDYLQHLKDVEEFDESEMAKGAGAAKGDVVRVGSVLIKKSEEDREDDEEEEEEDDDEFEDAEEVASTASAARQPSKQKLQLPASVFASKYEEDVGYFNQGAPDNDPKFNWDPDIVKLLDEDAEIDAEDPDNDLEDDFFVKANEPEGPKSSKSARKSRNDEEDGSDEDDEEDENEEDSDDDSNGHFERDEGDDDYDDQFETKSRFSEYSMTSSVIKRNEQLKLIDEHFEKFYAQYDDEQIGSLDTEEIEGFCSQNDLLFEAALKDFNKLMKKRSLEIEKPSRTKSDLGTLVEERSDLDGTEEGEDTLEEESDDDDDDDESTEDTDGEEDEEGNGQNYETVKYKVKKSKEDRFDCESIISTYSSLYNRPTVISEKSSDDKIRISKKTGLPIGVLAEKPKGKKELERLDHQITKVVVDVPTRKAEETKEEKKARKQAVKEQRRERRIEKKINKQAFKKEKANQLSQLSNNTQLAHSLKL